MACYTVPICDFISWKWYNLALSVAGFRLKKKRYWRLTNTSKKNGSTLKLEYQF